MVTLAMTSSTMDGEVVFTYNHKGYLDQLHISGVLTVKQYEWIFGYMPYHTDQIATFRDKTNTAKFVLTPIKVSFETMWDRYNDKVRSSKKKAHLKWARMTVDNQIRAYLYLPTYLRAQPRQRRKEVFRDLPQFRTLE